MRLLLPFPIDIWAYCWAMIALSRLCGAHPREAYLGRMEETLWQAGEGAASRTAPRTTTAMRMAEAAWKTTTTVARMAEAARKTKRKTRLAEAEAEARSEQDAEAEARSEDPCFRVRV